MKVTVRKSKYRGVVTVPPSKSDAHRGLICAGLAEGKSVIRGISGSEDMNATLSCLNAMGARTEREGDTVTVWGCDPTKRGEVTLPCRESGSTLRFFLPLCLLSDKPALLTGTERLMERPLSVYEKICVEQGIDILIEDTCVRLRGKLNGGFFRVEGDVSSQFISGLLFTLPLLPEYSVIELTPPVVSAPYIAMTAATLAAFGIRVECTGDDRILIPGGQTYTPTDYTVEGDWSNGAFFLALSALGHEVEVEGLRTDTLQGDSVIRRYLGRLRRSSPTLDISACPDLAPILMASAAALHGVTLTGTDRLKDKESDRGNVMAQELARLGVPVTVGENVITVTAPRTLTVPEGPLSSHNDHRIAMALAVLLTCVGGELEGAEAVRKSYPDFFEDLGALCIP